eukprot:SAG31_NODE_2801_length_5073_cov_12.272618_6_plen_103_part_00
MFGRFGRFEAVAGPGCPPPAPFARMVATAFLLQLLAAVQGVAGNQQLSLLPPNYSSSGLHSPLALVLKAFGLVASGSCARVCLGVGCCARGRAQEVAARIAQ